jgi:hypothetical protein
MTQACRDQCDASRGATSVPADTGEVSVDPLTKILKLISEILSDCIAAPSAHCAPQPSARPVGEFAGQTYYQCKDASALRTAAEWKLLGRIVKTGERPIGNRMILKPEAVFAEWQTG